MVDARENARFVESVQDVSTADSMEDDKRLMFIDDEQAGTVISRLQWKEDAGTHLKKAYNGTGRSTIFARKADMKKGQRLMMGCRPLTFYFASQSTAETQQQPGESTAIHNESSSTAVQNSALDHAIERLRGILIVSNNL
jgi:hypothetical protein